MVGEVVGLRVVVTARRVLAGIPPCPGRHATLDHPGPPPARPLTRVAQACAAVSITTRKTPPRYVHSALRIVARERCGIPVQVAALRQQETAPQVRGKTPPLRFAQYACVESLLQREVTPRKLLRALECARLASTDTSRGNPRKQLGAQRAHCGALQRPQVQVSASGQH